MMKKYIYLLSFGVVLGLSSCYYDNEEELYPNSKQTVNDTTVVSYSATIAPMMATNCTTPGCHASNGQPPNLTTYQGVSANKNSVKARAVDGSPTWMPSSGAMSKANRDALAKWINDGAPNN